MLTESAVVCEHSCAPDCGCFVNSAGQLRRHSFRFLKGDRVQHSTWKGFIGTVQGDTLGGLPLRVTWDRLPGLGVATPPARQDYWNVTHVENL